MVVMVLVNDRRRRDVPIRMPRFVPLRVDTPARNVFTRRWSWQEATLMDGREQDAVKDVDRIALAVEHLRHLLMAATRADLQAMRKQPATEPGATRE
jgi:hypothetical protein